MPNHRFSRREFARRAAIASAATLVPATAFSTATPASLPTAQQPANAPKLPPESEADARTQLVLTQYGSRLSDEQKTEIARISANVQRQLDTLRKFPTQNGDDPALYLKPLMEREKKPAPNPAATKPSATSKPAPATPKN